MSDIMRPMSFAQLLDWIRSEYGKGHVYGVRRAYVADEASSNRIFDRNLETVIGPAAGPNSQLAQNIIASYYAGARFFELKTVQQMDGRELAACVPKPCIRTEDEAYNCEWSTELTVPEALHEYINAWMALHFMAKEYGLGAMDGFQFNISVGYDLDGIKGEKVNNFIDNIIDAKNTVEFNEAKEVLLAHASEFKNMTVADIEAIPSTVCNSATISTLHGCPPEQIESIAMYLLTEKKINTFVKCNPTLLGYEFARKTMDDMGYDYMVFGREHFEGDESMNLKADLQYEDAVPMFKRLMAVSEELGLQFGLKLTNTFPVAVTRGELPSGEMYMSGRPLFGLTISLAAKIEKDFGGKLRIALSGGADAFNICEIVGCGIWPVTMATTLLKTGGYQRFTQMAEDLRKMGVPEWTGIDVDRLCKLAEDAVKNPRHTKGAKMPVNRKSDEKVPLMNCFTAPCQDRCPIHQDVATYMQLAGEGKYAEALQVILNTNALPHITGKICAHSCQSACTRNFYDDQVQIRDTKLLCAESAFDQVLASVKAGECCGKKVAVIGGGPAGMAAAYYLAKGGACVTVYEKRSKLGGIVDYAIPNFRIDQKEIGQDAKLLEAMGVEIKLNTEVSVADVKDGVDAVIVAIGATLPGTTAEGEIDALDFLTEWNATEGKVDLGKNVVVIGGGNTAMDVARAAKRNAGVEKVSLVYRRTKRYMPADEEELLLAIEDGVEFCELMAPGEVADGKMNCKVMKLGAMDASGRASVEATGEIKAVDCDSVIMAIGEKCDAPWYAANGINCDEKGRPLTSETLETNIPGVYVIGDALVGPSIIVKAEANAKLAAETILGKSVSVDTYKKADVAAACDKKGNLVPKGDVKDEGKRCLSCSTICENCVDVCPNRANIEILVPGFDMPQIIHVDYMCNECGNCAFFCPYASNPYKEKWTLFKDVEDLRDSSNEGFAPIDVAAGKYAVRFLGEEKEITLDAPANVPAGLIDIIKTVAADYSYLFFK
ncbi:MAG: putative selenate reductase subunit YgfK [Lachnospiraceae bacterium]|nr:putative selenate reductase subunit YgfK [Lachnospiraceae bacterium]